MWGVQDWEREGKAPAFGWATAHTHTSSGNKHHSSMPRTARPCIGAIGRGRGGRGGGDVHHQGLHSARTRSWRCWPGAASGHHQLSTAGPPPLVVVPLGSRLLQRRMTQSYVRARTTPGLTSCWHCRQRTLGEKSGEGSRLGLETQRELGHRHLINNIADRWKDVSQQKRGR